MTTKRSVTFALVVVAVYLFSLAMGFDQGVVAIVGGEASRLDATLGVVFIGLRLFAVVAVPVSLVFAAILYGVDKISELGG